MSDRVTAVAQALLEAVDALPPAARGLFVVQREGRRRGIVLVEHNRVCLAMALGLEDRLRQLVFERTGRWLDDRVLARHAGSSPALRGALRAHSIESLISLSADECDSFAWVARDAALNAEPLFAPAGLLAAVGARLYAPQAELAALGDSPMAGAAGGSFAIGDEGEPVLVAETDGERLGVAALLEMGAWAGAALEVTSGFSAGMIEQATAHAIGGVAIGWRSSRRVVHARLVTEAAALMRAVHAIHEAGCPVVVSVRFRWKLKDPVFRGEPGVAGNVNTSKEI